MSFCNYISLNQSTWRMFFVKVCSMKNFFIQCYWIIHTNFIFFLIRLLLFFTWFWFSLLVFNSITTLNECILLFLPFSFNPYSNCFHTKFFLFSGEGEGVSLSVRRLPSHFVRFYRQFSKNDGFLNVAYIYFFLIF